MTLEISNFLHKHSVFPDYFKYPNLPHQIFFALNTNIGYYERNSELLKNWRSPHIFLQSIFDWYKLHKLISKWLEVENPNSIRFIKNIIRLWHTIHYKVEFSYLTFKQKKNQILSTLCAKNLFYRLPNSTSHKTRIKTQKEKLFQKKNSELDYKFIKKI